MKSLLHKITDNVKEGAKKTGKFVKRNYVTAGLGAAMLLSALPNYSSGQNVSKDYTNQTKTTQVDTLWGKDNPTPDSVAYNVFSRPNIVKTYGKEGNDPNLNWEEMTPKEKANYFKKTMQKFIELYPKYNYITNVGDTVLLVGNELCYFYTNLANYTIEGKNNIENDPGSSLNKYSDIKQKTIENNGFFNLPHLYVSDISGDSANGFASHSVSGVFIKDKITQNTSIENDFEVRDSRTNDSSMPGTFHMAKRGTVTFSWYGWAEGGWSNYDLMNFQFDKDGKSYLTYINPKLITINSHLIHSSAEIPKNIDYSSDWASKLEKEIINTTNQDTTSTIHTDDTGTQVDISYLIKNKLSYSDTTDLHNATEGTFPINVTDTIKFIQKGIRKDAIHPNGRYYYTVLKEDVLKQTVNVTKNTTGINDHEAQSEKYGIQKAWPNPIRSGGKLYLDYNSKTNGMTNFKIVNILGQTVKEFNKNVKVGTQNLMFNSDFSPGTYILVATDKNGKMTTWKEIVQ